MYKLIFCDLDGTLLDDNKNISLKNIEYINRAINNNCKFVITSGRSNMSLDYFNRYLNLDKGENYAIAYNGSYIYRTDTGKVLREHLIMPELAIMAIKLCKNYDVDIMVYKNELLWFDKPTEKILAYAKRNRVKTKIVDNIENVANESVSKVIIIGTKSELLNVEKGVHDNNINRIMTTFFSATDLYEFNPYCIDKGTGIEELADILNVNINETIAIGDNYNDLSMIKKAGLGVCCINGEEGVKKCSDYITVNDNNNSAVAEVIDKFVLKNINKFI